VVVFGAGRLFGADPKTVALESVGRSTTDSVYDHRLRRLDSLIRENVVQQGFRVVPADTVFALRERLTDSMGGIYDTMTGRPDSALSAALSAAVKRALIGRYHADLRLFVLLETPAIAFDGGKVKWCGTEEKSGAPGGFSAFVGDSYYGKLPAATLVVTAFDTSGKLLYNKCGGIQVIAHVKNGAVVPIPADSIMIDTTLAIHAVHVALDSLGARVGVERAPSATH
jgi:hypothetical protein